VAGPDWAQHISKARTTLKQAAKKTLLNSQKQQKSTNICLNDVTADVHGTRRSAAAGNSRNPRAISYPGSRLFGDLRDSRGFLGLAEGVSRLLAFDVAVGAWIVVGGATALSGAVGVCGVIRAVL